MPHSASRGTSDRHAVGARLDLQPELAPSRRRPRRPRVRACRPAAASMIRICRAAAKATPSSDGAVQMGQAMRGAEAEKLRAGVAVRAEPFAGEIRQEEQPFGAGRRPAPRLRDDIVVAEAPSRERPAAPSAWRRRRSRASTNGPQCPSTVATLQISGSSSGCRLIKVMMRRRACHVRGQSRADDARAKQRHGIVRAADQHRRAFESPSRARPAAVTCPSISSGERIGGSLAAIEAERARSSACDHRPVRGFIRKLQEASPGSIATSPVRRKLM